MLKKYRKYFCKGIALVLAVGMLAESPITIWAEENEKNEYIEETPGNGETGDATNEESKEETSDNQGEINDPESEISESEVIKSEDSEPENTQEKEKKPVNIGGDDAPTKLKINLLDTPYGIKKNAVSFSWVDSINSEMSEQVGYRIVITKRVKDIKQETYVYDSNWINSSENSSQLYDLSRHLDDNELYYWQVQIKDVQGKESSFSEAQAFSTAVGNDWTSTQGSWNGSQKVTFFRTEFKKKEDIEKAILSVSATSTESSRQYVYNMYVNGTEIGVGPARQNGSELYYDTYDVTEYLNEGTNVLGAIAYSEKSAGFLCQLTYYMTDGTRKVITNSGKNRNTWKCKGGDSAYIGGNSGSIGTGYYVARQDNLDASAFPYGWNTVGYNADSWNILQNSNSMNGYSFVPSETETMKRHEMIPQSVTYKDGTYLIDFGKEIIGSLQLNINTSAAKITLEYGEELDEEGNAKYVLNTRNRYQETWKLKNGEQKLSGIGMKTFRYVTVRNYPVTLSVENVIGLALYQEFDEDASSFASSNNVLNDVYNLSRHTSKVNGQVLYVDSQNRERGAYEGDALITALNNYTYGHTPASSKYTAEWLLDNTTWPAEYSMYNIILIYQNYLETGDLRTLDQSYKKLKNKTLEQYYDSSAGLMRKVEDTALRQKIIVDWPASNRDGYNMTDSYYNTVFNAACVGGYESMAKIAEALGYEGDVSYYQTLSDTIKRQMINKMYDSSTGEFKDGLKENGEKVNHSAQHATAYALAFGIYDSQEMADAMAGSIEADEEVKMSIFGTYFLLQGLYRSNHGSLARKIMSNSESILGVQSWGYVMYGMQATASPEAWNSQLKSNMSMNHPWGTAPGVALMRGMFGINPTTPGYDTFDIRLQPGGVSEGSIKVPTIKGNISVSYVLGTNGTITVNAEVPANTKATLYIPVAQGQSELTVDGALTEGINDGKYLSCELKAGAHQVSVLSKEVIDNSEFLKTDVVYRAYNTKGWSEQVTNGIKIGTETDGKIQAVNMEMRNQDISGTIEYSAYMQGSGWQDWLSAGNDSGMPGANKRMEAVKVRLTEELAQKYDVYYRVYVDGDGWLDWASNGDPAGSSGRSKAIYSIQIKLLKKDDDAPGDMANAYLADDKGLLYQTHVQSYGWQKEVSSGAISGTIGKAKRLEAIKLRVENAEVEGGITYSTHVQSYGWQGWKKDGQLSGTSGKAKRLEAIKIKLTGELAEKYDVYYRVHAQTFGWMGWAKNGEPAGTEGYARRLEAIQVILVKKGSKAPGTTENAFKNAEVSYRTHVQSYGWKSYVYDGELSGTSGQAKRLEAIQIKNMVSGISGHIQYQTHVQSYGWQGWKKDGQLSGTSGKAKRLEAIKIKLTGKLAEKYDVYYRVHVQSYGWLDWAKNGEPSGTEGLAKRLEAIEIQYVKKGMPAPGRTTVAFKEK